MKLAEALLIRADMQKKLANLKSRINENVKVQSGDNPSENPETLFIETQQLIGELYSLIAKIHRTNAIAVMPNGQNLLTALIERDELLERYRVLQDAIGSAKLVDDRYSYREIKWERTIDIVALQKQADDIAVKLRQLNIELQAMNWQIDLIDEDK